MVSAATGRGIDKPRVLEPASVQALFASGYLAAAAPADRQLVQKSDMTKDLRTFLRKYNVQTVMVLQVPRALHFTQPLSWPTSPQP